MEDIFLAEGNWGVMVEATGLNAGTDITEYYTLTDTTYTAAADSWKAGTTYYKLIDKTEVTANKGGKYYPINWKVAATGSATTISETKDLAEISKKMIEGIVAGTHNAGSLSAASYTLTWEWLFSTSEANDRADTILGNLMARDKTTGKLANGTVVKEKGSGVYTSSLTDGTDYNLDVVFGMKVTATQVD